MILVNQYMQPDSRTQNNGSAWIAEAMVDGKLYSARSRHGAPMALARELVAAGVGDQPVRVSTDGVAGHLTYRSLHRMAGRTIVESATKSVRDQKWVLADHVWGKNRDERGGDDEQAVGGFTPHDYPPLTPLASKVAA